jgi:hypothetical protein
MVFAKFLRIPALMPGGAGSFRDDVRWCRGRVGPFFPAACGRTHGTYANAVRTEFDLVIGEMPSIHRRGADRDSRQRFGRSRQFAPYVGIDVNRHLGNTADSVRAASEPALNRAIVAGVRIRF